MRKLPTLQKMAKTEDGRNVFVSKDRREDAKELQKALVFPSQIHGYVNIFPHRLYVLVCKRGQRCTTA